MNNQATKTQWKVLTPSWDYQFRKYSCRIVEYENSSNFFIIYGENKIDCENNAKIIVKSVNCYDELVETVKDLLKEVQISLGNCEQEEKLIIEERIKWAKQTLQKAG